ncbi:hypothetical protein PHMEG_0006599 [Phytophthora megakarya]|uniref:Uncharacterized protein n=1 Tax=Phytophthora megakarya TaxID=4795 RepID=A0A225WNI3_9STRA|nr:hypothetical protein PHMEG_0006599 [Phytophthora megakarya]
MIDDIQKHRGRKMKRDSSSERGLKSSYRRDSHYRDDNPRDESSYRPRITLADALSDLVTALNETLAGSQTSQSRSYNHGYETNKDSFGDGERRDDEDRYSNRGSEYDYAGEDDRGHVAAANNHERRAAAEGTFARLDNRRPKGDGHFNNDRGFARDNRNGRQQYGLTHSVHYCYKRCKLCKQVHDAGKCEAFNEVACLLLSKVDKNNLTPMLQGVVYARQLKLGLIPIGLPQLNEPAIDADHLFAFAGEVKWPEDRETGFVSTTEFVEENDVSLGENKVDELDVGEHDGYLTEASTSNRGPNQTSSRSLVRSAKLLPGERLGS